MPRYLLPLAAATLLTGCGTMANVNGTSYALIGPPDSQPRPFGGVANDLRWFREQTGYVVDSEDVLAAPINAVMACYFGIIDLPFSLVGDIVTLPSLLRGDRATRPATSGPPAPEPQLPVP